MKNLLAETITIGDEILYGQTLDTNSHWISSELNKIGIKVLRKTTVGDNETEIMDALALAEQKVRLILITGGLGPTNDDLTKPCMARYFGVEMQMNQQALEDVTDFLTSKGKEVTELNKRQALLPDNAQIIRNRNGTAPGMWFEKEDKVFISMPGVPHEMREMMLNDIIPRLQDHFQTDLIYHKMINTVGIGESWLSEMIKSWEDSLPEHIRLAYLPSMGMVKLRLTATGEDMDQMQLEVARQIEKLKTLAGEYIYGYDNIRLEEAIGNLLRDNNLTLAVAESCSGGYIAHLITTIPGSSDYFYGGIIPYQNQIKSKFLGVNPETLEQFGAVSEQTVIEMAQQVRQKFGTAIGLASSGIAGPGGGTPDKPVGTVWIAMADHQGVSTEKLSLGKDRVLNIKQSAIRILNLMRQRLKNNGKKA
ncbi:MAG: competence/damage-inducible protein A [Candidatus Cyclobacteriaceae bacterium M3_2C_046]